MSVRAPTPTPTSGVAVATFKGCHQVVFGYPNDEAQPGHPLYPAGGWSYGFYEVLGSDWAARLWAQNRVVFPDWTPPDKRHFLVACHEDLVEVLADDVEVEVSPRPFEAVALEALRHNLRDHHASLPALLGVIGSAAHVREPHRLLLAVAVRAGHVL
jgi:hypothetical protein